jgi:hypothetical protein
MRNCSEFFLRLCVLTLFWVVGMGTYASAHDHLTGKVVSFEREQNIIIVQKVHKHKRPDIVTIHMLILPQALETGALVHAHGRYHKNDRSNFDATRIEIKSEDLTGVRERLLKIIKSKRDESGQPEDREMPEIVH